MIKHGMDVQRQVIAHLSPGQIPVTTMDQPLFALAKLVPWKWPSPHGEHLHVVMLGKKCTHTRGDLLKVAVAKHDELPTQSYLIWQVPLSPKEVVRYQPMIFL